MQTGNDDELQEWLDNGGQGQQIPVTKDLEAYRLVFETLKLELSESLSPGFSAKVVSKVRSQLYSKRNRGFYLWTAAIFILVITIAYSSMAIINNPDSLRLLNTFWEYKGIGLFVLCLLLFLQYFDDILAKGRTLYFYSKKN
jgi:hypothetical protein